MTEKKSNNIDIGAAWLRSGQYGEYFSLALGNDDFEILIRRKSDGKTLLTNDRYVNLSKINYRESPLDSWPTHRLTVSKNKKQKRN